MRITLNGPPGQATGLLVKIPRPPDKVYWTEPRLRKLPGGPKPNDSTLRRIVNANQTARRVFPPLSQEGENKLNYQKYDLGSPLLAPVVKPAAKTTLSMSYLF